MSKSLVLCFAVLVLPCTAMARTRYAEGTVVNMEMSSCMRTHSFMAMMSGQNMASEMPCAEYTFVTDTVVYTLVAERANEFVPLAEQVQFVIAKNTMNLISDDEKRIARFSIRQMMLRTEWERQQKFERDHAGMVVVQQIREPEYRPSPRTAVLASGLN